MRTSTIVAVLLVTFTLFAQATIEDAEIDTENPEVLKDLHHLSPNDDPMGWRAHHGHLINQAFVDPTHEGLGEVSFKRPPSTAALDLAETSPERGLAPSRVHTTREPPEGGADKVKLGEASSVESSFAAGNVPVKHKKKSCYGARLTKKKYSSKTKAEKACNSNAACYGMYDNNCDSSGSWYLCKLSSTWKTSSKGCIYAKAPTPAPHPTPLPTNAKPTTQATSAECIAMATAVLSPPAGSDKCDPGMCWVKNDKGTNMACSKFNCYSQSGAAVPAMTSGKLITASNLKVPSRRVAITFNFRLIGDTAGTTYLQGGKAIGQKWDGSPDFGGGISIVVIGSIVSTSFKVKRDALKDMTVKTQIQTRWLKNRWYHFAVVLDLDASNVAVWYIDGQQFSGKIHGGGLKSSDKKLTGFSGQGNAGATWVNSACKNTHTDSSGTKRCSKGAGSLFNLQFKGKKQSTYTTNAEVNDMRWHENFSTLADVVRDPRGAATTQHTACTPPNVFLITDPCKRTGTCWAPATGIPQSFCAKREGVTHCSKGTTKMGVMMQFQDPTATAKYHASLMNLQKSVVCVRDSTGKKKCSVSKVVRCYVYIGSDTTDFINRLRHYQSDTQQTASMNKWFIPGLANGKVVECKNFAMTEDKQLYSPEDAKKLWLSDTADFTAAA